MSAYDATLGVDRTHRKWLKWSSLTLLSRVEVNKQWTAHWPETGEVAEAFFCFTDEVGRPPTWHKGEKVH